MHVYRGAASGISDHFLVEGRLKGIGRWRRGRDRLEGRRVVKVKELNKREKDVEYKETIRNRWERVTVLEK